MTIEQCYQEVGGSYAEVCGRLPSPRLVEKFVRKFLDDQSYAALTTAMAAGDPEAAFRAAHTLKGVAANLSFTRLCACASRLTELLRAPEGLIHPESAPLLAEVTREYEATVAAIRQLD